MTLRQRSIAYSSAAIVVFALLAAFLTTNTLHAKVNITPDPVVDDALAAQSGQRMAVLAGGCFWGLQLVFEHVKGVIYVTAGYAGGSVRNPSYLMVSSGQTGHAESVKIVYDPSKVKGTQYRSIIFFNDEDQERIARAYITELTEVNAFSHKIVTQVVPYQPFYQAETYHQDYAVHNQFNPYIVTYDLPKLDDLRKSLPDLYVKH
jgi:peptide-methionine (S)-S-oxide reductase